MKLQIFPSDEWKVLAENAHLVCFNEVRPASMNRIDFALLVVDEHKPLVYGTFREVDSQTVYMQYGGSFPGTIGTPKSYKGYSMILAHLKTKYKYVTTLVKNDNLVMMKFAMKQGLRIVGVRVIDNEIFLEHFAKMEEVLG